MTQAQLRQTIEEMAHMPGVDGCALVEIGTGMVWHHAVGFDDVELFAEAASDYWRLYTRLSPHFESMGKLRASIMVHKKGRLTLLPCSDGMLLLALTGPKAQLDWMQWQKKVQILASLVEAF